MLDQLLSKVAEPVAGTSTVQQALLNLSGQSQTKAVTEADLQDFNDYDALRTRVFTKAIDAVKSMRPVQNEKYTLRVSDVKYDSEKPFTRQDYKKAIQENRTLARKITGKYELLDNATGKVIGATSRKTIVNVPYMTEFGTFVRNGNDISIQNQMRLRAGVYTRFTSDGYPEAQFNAKPGTGPSVRTWMDPETSIFYLSMKGRNVPLYPIMKSMGVDDNHMKASWGEDIYKANATDKISGHAQRWLNEMKAEFDERNAKANTAPVTEQEADFTSADNSTIEGTEQS